VAELCAGGKKLRRQVNYRWPRRDRASDGWIGDRDHQNRKSDHNPYMGVVYAIDLDENMGKVGKWRNGRTAQRLADELIAYAASNLPGSNRVKYVVYEGSIASGTYKKTFWRWRGKKYGHTQHIHVSFTHAAKDDGQVFPLPCLTKNAKKKKKWRKALG
jgi:hypothetical protein